MAQISVPGSMRRITRPRSSPVCPTIREALAKGADRGLHIDCNDLGSRDALGVARLLAAAVKPENPDLILTGLQSDDLGQGQTGVILAELLGLPHSSLILHDSLTADVD